MTIMILARTNATATEFALRAGLKRHEWSYIKGRDSLRGLAMPYVCRVGDYFMRDHLHEIEEELVLRQSIYIAPVDIKQLIS